MTTAKFPKLLIDPLERVNPKDPQSPLKSTREGPLKLRWYNDPQYRQWEEAKSICAAWGLTQKLSVKVFSWLMSHGITAQCEFPAAGFKTDAAARADFEDYQTGRRGGVEPQPLLASQKRSTVELHAGQGKRETLTVEKGNTPE